MRYKAHSKGGELSIWLDEPPRGLPTMERRVLSNQSATEALWRPGITAAEFKFNRHVSSYGMLVIEYLPNDKDSFILARSVLVEDTSSQDILLSCTSAVHWGLEKSYLDTVVEHILAHNKLPCGTLTILDGAHCLLRSSIHAFKILTDIIIQIVCFQGDCYQGFIESLLRNSMQTQPERSYDDCF